MASRPRSSTPRARRKSAAAAPAPTSALALAIDDLMGSPAPPAATVDLDDLLDSLGPAPAARDAAPADAPPTDDLDGLLDALGIADGAPLPADAPEASAPATPSAAAAPATDLDDLLASLDAGESAANAPTERGPATGEPGPETDDGLDDLLASLDRDEGAAPLPAALADLDDLVADLAPAAASAVTAGAAPAPPPPAPASTAPEPVGAATAPPTQDSADGPAAPADAAPADASAAPARRGARLPKVALPAVRLAFGRKAHAPAVDATARRAPVSGYALAAAGMLATHAAAFWIGTLAGTAAAGPAPLGGAAGHGTPLHAAAPAPPAEGIDRYLGEGLDFAVDGVTVLDDDDLREAMAALVGAPDLESRLKALRPRLHAVEPVSRTGAHVHIRACTRTDCARENIAIDYDAVNKTVEVCMTQPFGPSALSYAYDAEGNREVAQCHGPFGQPPPLPRPGVAEPSAPGGLAIAPGAQGHEADAAPGTPTLVDRIRQRLHDHTDK